MAPSAPATSACPGVRRRRPTPTKPPPAAPPPPARQPKPARPARPPPGPPELPCKLHPGPEPPAPLPEGQTMNWQCTDSVSGDYLHPNYLGFRLGVFRAADGFCWQAILPGAWRCGLSYYGKADSLGSAQAAAERAAWQAD